MKDSTAMVLIVGFLLAACLFGLLGAAPIGHNLMIPVGSTYLSVVDSSGNEIGRWRVSDKAYLGSGSIFGMIVEATTSMKAPLGTITTLNSGTANWQTGNASGTLSMTGTSANIALGLNYLSGDGDDEGVYVDSSGKVGIGTTAPGSKLDIRDGDLHLTSTTVTTGWTHGTTHYGVDENTFGSCQTDSANDGGLRVWGVSETAGQRPMLLAGVFGNTNPTDTVPGIVISAGKNDGGGGTTILASDETVFRVDNWGNTGLMTILGSGKIGIATNSPTNGVVEIGSVAGVASSVYGTTASFLVYVDRTEMSPNVQTAYNNLRTMQPIKKDDGSYGVDYSQLSPNLKYVTKKKVINRSLYNKKSGLKTSVEWNNNTVTPELLRNAGKQGELISDYEIYEETRTVDEPTRDLTQTVSDTVMVSVDAFERVKQLEEEVERLATDLKKAGIKF